jgi:hypothetical protein
MNNIRILSILALAVIHSHLLPAQIVSGKVADSESGEPVPYAHVYFSNSGTGTTTDQDGHFKLNISKNKSQSIVTSSMGYESLILDTYSPDKYYLIYLTPKAIQLEEVIIGTEHFSRRKSIRIFKREFLGKTSNARNCTILNSKDLRFSYFKSSKTLEACSYQPLVIYNKALGYRITYYLNEFRHNYSSTFFEGNFLFEEDTTLSPKEKNKVAERRKIAYYGSRMHFIRALWNENLHQTGFEVRDRRDGQPAAYPQLVKTDSSNTKLLNLKSPVSVYFNGRRTYLDRSENAEVIFTQNGFFSPKGLNWDGSMAAQRMADALPFEYFPEDETGQ